MVFRGNYSKCAPRQKRDVVCEQFGKALHLPASIVRLLQSEIVSMDQLNGLNQSAMGTVKSISEDNIVNVFSHLTTTI